MAINISAIYRYNIAQYKLIDLLYIFSIHINIGKHKCISWSALLTTLP